MIREFFAKRSALMASLFLITFILLTGNSNAAEIENNPVPIHLNIKESVKLSPETSGDLSRTAIEEKHSSYESNPGAGTPASTRNKGDFKSMGIWESDSVAYDVTISNPHFNLWWSEDTNDESYEAELELIWTVYVDGTQVFQEQFGEVDNGYECEDNSGNDRQKDDPCEFLEQANNFPSTTLVKGQVLSVEIEMRAYQTIYVFYDNFTRDSGMKIVTDAVQFGYTGISGNTISFEFIEAWSTDSKGALNANFITIISEGIELDNSQQSGSFPKVENGRKYVVNETEIESKRITWIIEDQYAKLEQTMVSFSYCKKDTSTTAPIMINVADRLASSVSSSEDEGVLGLPGFEFASVICALALSGFVRRKV